MLEIYGQGSLLSTMKEHAAALGLEKHIVFHPFSVDIHRKVADASMFVLGSDYEGLSNSMLESMALGLPCIVTDCPCGGAKMMITSYENGILVPVRDVKAMYGAMKYIIDNPEKAAAISRNAAKVRADLAVGNIVAEWERII
jgi:glycosyltransferase involved in cell wall biosynthesis